MPFVRDPKEMAKYYQACDLYIHTAKAENAPLVILEAMACGKPVIATNAGGIPELVRNDDTGYTVPIGDAESMANLIISLIDAPEQLTRLGESASNVAKKEYGRSKMVDAYLNLYQSLIFERKV